MAADLAVGSAFLKSAEAQIGSTSALKNQSAPLTRPKGEI
jgi:hypothetical protein